MEGNNGKQGFSYRKPAAPGAYAPLIYALILAFGVMLGFVINSITAGKQTVTGGKYDKLRDIMNYIQLKYVDTVNQTQLLDKTIDKMLSNLDPHSVYIPATDVNEVNEQLEGNFEGIGIEFYLVQDTITVVTAIPGGPSEIAGIKSGDRIVQIDDSVVAGIKIKDTDVKHKLRGPKGTKVKVGILRSGRPQLLAFNILRDKIPLYSVDAAYMVNDQTGYIKINNFAGSTHQEFAEKIHALKERGMKKLIIDLRGNPGGYLAAATALADEVIPGNQLLVYTQGKAYDRQEYKSSKTGMFEEGELCVLLDQGSASASEIFAGAVQDLDRGTIIGRTSFGKGLVQEQYDLQDGSALRLTIARYYTPSGRSIQRPYDRGSEEYYNEIYERYMRGEFVHEDSIVNTDSTIYKTAKGRRVYGGGGIRPDIFVPMDTSADNEYYFRIRSYVPEFVYKYSSANSGFLENYKNLQEFKNNFKVTDALMNEFYTYAEGAGLKRDKAKDARLNDKVRLSLMAFIAKQGWRMEGYYLIANQDDKVIERALQKLKD